MSQDPIRRRDYDDDDAKPQKAGINPLVIGIGAVILSLLAVFFLFSPVSQKTIDAKLTDATINVTKVSTDLTAKFDTLKASITDANTKQINAALANIPTTQSVTDAKNMATQAQTTATQAQTTATQALNAANNIKIPVDDSVIVTGLKSTIDALQTTINTQQVSMNTMQKEIDDIVSGETVIEQSTDTTGTTISTVKPTITMVIPTTSTLTYSQIGSTEVIKSIKVKIYNGTTKDFNNITLQLNLNGSNLNNNFDVQVDTTTGKTPDLAFSIYDNSNISKLVYYSGTSFDLSVGEYLYLYLDIGLTSVDGNSHSITLTPSFSISDYSN